MIWIAVVAIILIGAAVLVVIGLREGNHEDPLQSRLAEFADRGDAISLEEIELS